MIYPELAQQVIANLIGALRASVDANEAVNQLTKDLAVGLNADRVVIWQLTDGGLRATNEFSSAPVNILGTTIDSIESSQILLNFLSVSTDGSTIAPIELDSESLQKDGDWSPFHDSLAGMNSTLVAQLRARGVLAGCLVLQTQNQRQWSKIEIATIERVSEVVSLLMSYLIEVSRLTSAQAG